MKRIQTIALGLLMACCTHLAFAGDLFQTYFINSSNAPINIHYKACHDAEPSCASSPIQDAVIAASSYLTIEVPAGQKEIKVLSMEAFGKSITDLAAVDCGVNPLTNNAVKYEVMNDALTCSHMTFKKI